MPNISPRTKHIGLPYHWLRNKLSSLKIDIQVVSSAYQLHINLPRGFVMKSLKVQKSSLWDSECTET